jgi:hypothetical protein
MVDFEHEFSSSDDSSSDDDDTNKVLENESDHPYDARGHPSPPLDAVTLRCNCTGEIPFSFLPRYILYGGLLMRLTQNQHPTGSYRVVQENNPQGGD